MLCDVCHRNQAEKKLYKSVNGSMQELHVCKDCFNRGGESIPEPPRKCRFCGRTLDQINQSLIVGCPKCYDEFARELDLIIRQVQKL